MVAGVLAFGLTLLLGSMLSARTADLLDAVLLGFQGLSLLLMFSLFALVSAHSHGVTISAKQDLENIGFTVKNINVDNERVTLVNPQGCLLSFAITKSDNGFRPVVRNMDGATAVVSPDALNFVAKSAGCNS